MISLTPPIIFDLGGVSDMQPIKAKQQSSESKLSSISAKKSVKKKGDRARKKLALKEARIHQKIAPSRSYHHYIGSPNHNF